MNYSNNLNNLLNNLKKVINNKQNFNNKKADNTDKKETIFDNKDNQGKNQQFDLNESLFKDYVSFTSTTNNSTINKKNEENSKNLENIDNKKFSSNLNSIIDKLKNVVVNTQNEANANKKIKTDEKTVNNVNSTQNKNIKDTENKKTDSPVETTRTYINASGYNVTETYNSSGKLEKIEEIQPAKEVARTGSYYSGGLKYVYIPQYDSLGQINGYTQTTTVASTGEKLGVSLLDSDKNFVKNISTEDCDGKLGYLEQGDFGTCWMLSTLKSLDNNGVDFEKEGIIKWNNDGSATVRLYDTDEFKDPLNTYKEYTFSASELAQTSLNVSGVKYNTVKGDRTAVAIERATILYQLERNGNKNVTDISKCSCYEVDSCIASSTTHALAMLFGADKYEQYAPKFYYPEESDFTNAKTVNFNPSYIYHGTTINYISESILDKYLICENGNYYVKTTDGKEIKMYYPHIYSVDNYDELKDTFILTNPHNYCSFEISGEIIRNCFFATEYNL